MSAAGQTPMPASTEVRCKCGSRDLDLVEEGVWTTTFNVSGGRLDRAKGFHEPGTIERLGAECSRCGRRWRPRRSDRRAAIQITDVVTLDTDPLQAEQGAK